MDKGMIHIPSGWHKISSCYSQWPASCSLCIYFWNFPFHIFRPGLSMESETADNRGPTVRARSQEIVSELEIQKRWVSKAYGEVGTEATEERLLKEGESERRAWSRFGETVKGTGTCKEEANEVEGG